MGRKKLEIKRIEDKNARQVTFSKRRSGLLKKAKELSILCDVQVAAIVISNRGRQFEYASNNTSLPEILEKYNQSVEEEAGPSTSTNILENQDPSSKYAGLLTSQELLQIVESDITEQCDDQLSTNDLQNLENQIEYALLQTKSAQMRRLQDSVASLKGKEKSLEEENRLLGEQRVVKNKKLHEQRTKLNIDLNVPATEQPEGNNDQQC